MKKIRFLYVLGLILVLSACKQADDLYKEYLVPLNLTYPGIALDVEARSGNRRIEIVWKNGSDPNVVKARISWNNFTKWEEVTIPPGATAISHIIEPLEENIYSFMVQTYDVADNVSLPVEVIGIVYGELYEKSLLNRWLKSYFYDLNDQSITLEWNNASETEAGVSFSYTDNEGIVKTLIIDKSETSTTISDINIEKPVSYSTMYQPDSTAIDVFYAPTIETVIELVYPVVEIPKNTWTVYNLPGDIGTILAMPGMWDGNTDGNGIHVIENQTLPITFTWDLGVRTILHRLKLWPRGGNFDDVWRRGHPRVFEIYGSLAPNPDGSLDGSWKLLGSFEIVNPHPEIAEPWNDPTMQAIARAGFEFEFDVPEGLPDPAMIVRYIRFKSISTFSGDQLSRTSIAELTFWGSLFR